MASKRAIDSFLSCRRIAVVGVSRDPKDFSRAVLRELLKRGYDVVPVSPALAACRQAGLVPITGLCPFMALPDAGWFHGLHRMFRREARATVEVSA